MYSTKKTVNKEEMDNLKKTVTINEKENPLRVIRLVRGLRLKDVADRIGLLPASLLSWEKGATGFAQLRRIHKLSQVLDYSFQELCGLIIRYSDYNKRLKDLNA